MKAVNRTVKIISISAVSILTVFFIGTYLIWNNNYRGRVYPGVKIGDLDLGGKTLAEAGDLISQRVKLIETAGLKFQDNKKSVILTANTASFDSDLSISALSFETENTALAAYQGKTNKSFFDYLFSLIKPKSQKEARAAYLINQGVIKSFLADNFPELNIEPANAYFSVINKDGQTELSVNPEKLGKEIDYDQISEEIKTNLDALQNKIITIKTRSRYPTVKEIDLVGIEPEAQKILSRDGFTLRFSETNDGTSSPMFWKIVPETIITWVSVQKTANGTTLSFDNKKIGDYLKSNISPKIDQEAILPRFEIKDGHVINWQTSQNGRQVDLEASATKITEEFLSGQNEINLIIKEITSETLTADNNFKIKEIIGTGHSNFTGSPANRRHNIKVGADALHGLLIKSDEEFSLLKALGDVSDKTGYLPELVIKGNKTVPEFGGGLCQIGTTIFRTALSTGLPITMRQSHSYRVSYYEPAGTDATIYNPQPDVRFVNDTGNYILIQARIVKNDIYFDFWGVKDGRIATTTYPTIYNIVKPEPTKIIESEDLKPGEKKCTESSHNGADAYFDYKVIYPEGSTTTPIQERRFKSHYIPWQAVCLVGKASSTAATSSNFSLDQKATGTPVASSSLNNP
jgi:vancomycin resistance protein YoaR